MLLKQTMVYFVLSFIAVFAARYIHLGILYLDMVYTYLNVLLTPYLYNEWIRNVVITVTIPIGIVGVPALIYRLIQKKDMPHFIPLVWIVWMIFTLCNILIK